MDSFAEFLTDASTLRTCLFLRKSHPVDIVGVVQVADLNSNFTGPAPQL